jgi:hypothetical protein
VNQNRQTLQRKISSAVPRDKKPTKNYLTSKIQLAETVPVPNLTVIMQFPVSRGDSIFKSIRITTQ